MGKIKRILAGRVHAAGTGWGGTLRPPLELTLHQFLTLARSHDKSKKKRVASRDTSKTEKRKHEQKRFEACTDNRLYFSIAV